ncbi:chromophore lyase CpcT/CpeT [Litorimonas haliclonae]|uniref:chromophore lyase CpcT/CpeT n=1 Tax=Litorimonas haliclonae TaxID=2081977 RepID=UPI0039EE3BBC
MLKPLISVSIGALYMCFAPTALAQDGVVKETAKSPTDKILDRDMARMMRWFPGHYDNMEQVYFEEDLGIDQDIRHNRIHSIFTPVDLPGFPGKTFYVEQYQNDNPEDVYRQRIYSFTPDYTEQAIKLNIYIPKNADAIKGAYSDLSKLDGLKLTDFSLYPGCEVYWTYENESFRGYMKEGACQIESSRSGKTLIITDNLQLSKTSIWIQDEAEDSEGNYVYGNKAGVPHKLRKARPFSCWVSPQKENGEYAFYNDIQLHDQGGRAWVTGEGHERVGLKMRNVVWPTGSNRNSLVLYAYRGEDENHAVSYSWTSPDSERLAMNLRWVQASCTLGNEEITPGINLATGGGNEYN